MKTFKNREEAFASQDFDPAGVKLEGVPPQHVDATKAFINLCVAHDAVNPEFQPDWRNYARDKFEAIHKMGSPSGAGFSFHAADGWSSHSFVGSRLASGSREATRHIAEIFEEDYRAMKVYDREIKK